MESLRMGGYIVNFSYFVNGRADNTDQRAKTCANVTAIYSE